MRYYFAPMEGLTDRVYRRLHHQYFGGPDRYFMPFLSPTPHRALTPREARELPPASSEAFAAVPQLLTKSAEDFLWAASVCRDLGYDQVNLNLGCPSGTVTAKGKGAGMLRDLDALDRFLDAVYSAAPLPISVKTRLGFEDPEEFSPLLDIFNRYPIAELTLHPRVRKAFYSGPVHRDSFRFLLANSKNPVCYNGDLASKADIAALKAEFPTLQAVMLGRGLIADPGLLLPQGTAVDTLEAFTDALLLAFRDAYGGERNAMFRLKEHWALLLTRFENADKLAKALRKTTDIREFQSLTHQILHTCPRK